MDDDLFDAARNAMKNAYAPYSGFRVGAVVRAGNGRLYAGCNVENAAYPQGCCAEASAISAMVLAGQTVITEVAVMGAGEALVTPCGGCRQRIREFARDDVVIHIYGPEGRRRSLILGDLLPMSFGPDNLKGDNA